MYLFVKGSTRMHIRCQFRERTYLTTIKPEVENSDLEVAREFVIRARTVADAKTVRRTILPTILVLTFLPRDIIEMGHR